MAAGGSKLVIYASIAANLSIAILKFIAAGFTGSAAMMSEGIHSVIDTTNGMLLLLGIKRSKKGPTKLHPFGHGKEVYFWSFIVAIFIFSLGGGVAIYEGIKHLLHPPTHVDHSNIMWSYGVLLGGAVFEGISLMLAWRQFRTVYPTGFKSALEHTKDAATLAVIVENAAAMIGLLLALLGITLTYFTHNPMFDALASISIGVLLTYVAYFMAVETRKLLIGESISDEDIQEIKDILIACNEIDFHGNIRSMHLGPDDVMLGIEVNFKDDVTVSQLEKIINKIKADIKKKDEQYTHIYIESNSIQDSEV